MKYDICIAAVVAAAVLGTGCAGTGVAGRNAPGAVPAAGADAAGAPAFVARSLRVAGCFAPVADPAAAQAARRFAHAVSAKTGQAMEERGFAGDDTNFDVYVSIESERVTRAELANWHIYEGKSRVTVHRADGALIGVKSFETDLNKRVLDEEAAEAPVVRDLSRQISAWLAEILAPGQAGK